MIRLDKFLAEMGVGTRSQVKQFLKKRMVAVNGKTDCRPEQKIDPQTDTVCFEGKPIVYAAYEYYMLYKPAGCVSAVSDDRHPTVLDYIESVRSDLFPVGRLDLDTEGLLLITNDGALSHRLLSPAHHVPKTYYVKAAGKVAQSDADWCERGIDIGDDKHTRPAKMKILTAQADSELLLTVTEGRYHQIKRMCAALGHPVLYLKRISFGPLALDPSLRPGQYRALTQEEINELQQMSIGLHIED